MKVVVISDQNLKTEWLTQCQQPFPDIDWVETIIDTIKADCVIDLLFDESQERINSLINIPAGLIILNSVNTTLKNLPAHFIRINGWPGFLKRPIVEAAALNDSLKPIATSVFVSVNKKVEWVPDSCGLVTPRIISMIINEAYFALQEGVTTKSETDIALKLGTNYPYGPFEWCDRIGIKKVFSLLQFLSKENIRYQPSELLTREAQMQ